MSARTGRSEIGWVIAWAVVIVLVSSAPYMVGIASAPPGYHFLGLTHNIDDGAVYLSWMKQASDGHFFIRNLFTNEPQTARQFNVLFLVMGWTAHLAHLPLIWTFHLFRMLLGVGFMLCVYKFGRLFLNKPEQRRALIPIVGLSSGIGWLLGARPPTGSVDMWQPEAITFLSIYLNPLFLAGLLLMLGSLYFLIDAQRTGRALSAVYAGLLLLLLGNVHTYDVITVGCVWTAYLAVLWAVERRFPRRLVLMSLLAALIALPSVGYQFYLYRIDEVFRARANSAAPSPAIWSFFAGYGLVLAGAAVGAGMLLMEHRRLRPAKPAEAPNGLVLIVWSVVGFAIPYIPVGQQRKLIMGLHVPLCILCAYAIARLLTLAPGNLQRLVLVLFITICCASNARFLADDASAVSTGCTAPGYAPYISSAELAAMDYLGKHAAPSDSVLAPPDFALFTPALAGRQVQYGHWSETPNYGEGINRWAALGNPATSLDAWSYIVSDNTRQYYVSTDRRWDPPPALISPRMIECFRSGPVGVYRIGR